MKDNRGRKLTRMQKVLLGEKHPRMKAECWLCVLDNGDAFTLRNKRTGALKVVGY